MSVYAVIMAGGKGERLWPASTRARPKPFLPLGREGKSLIQATYDRVLPLTGRERLYVVTESALALQVKAALGLADARLLVEPQGRNTAPAIGLAALAVSLADPEGIMIALPADHLIEDEVSFRKALQVAVEAAREGHLVTLGIEPSCPATGYGYIQRGELLGSSHGHDIFKVKRFTEKPDEDTARRFLSEGGYYWNSGIFVWRAARILEEINRFLPKLSQALKKLAGLWRRPGWEEALRKSWQEVEAISIDYGVMERAEDVVVVPASFGWHDLGDWQAVWEVFPRDENGVAVRGEHLGMDTARALIWARPGKTVATLGVSNVAIVDTQDALLVAALARSQQVRELARQAQPAPPEWDELFKLDTSGMLEVVAGFPDQCRKGLELGEEVDLPQGLSGFSRVLCVGMGGSGITGDLLGRFLSIPVIPCRGYRVPSYIGEETLLIGVSYSGNTEETLSAFQEGLSRTRRALAISSGGKLRELCASRGIPWIGIPGGYQPRAALGYLLFTLLSVLRRLGAAHLDLKEALATLAEQAKALGPASPGNQAQAIARALVGGVPLIYGTYGNTGPVAFRWKTQINENAKQPAFWAELPELCHNEIVGWELAERVLPGGRVVFLRTGHDHPRVQARIEILKEVLLRRGLSYLEVEGEGKSEAAQLFSLLYLGDWVSVYLALLNGVDPTPVRPIQELKERLARL